MIVGGRHEAACSLSAAAAAQFQQWRSGNSAQPETFHRAGAPPPVIRRPPVAPGRWRAYNFLCIAAKTRLHRSGNGFPYETRTLWPGERSVSHGRRRCRSGFSCPWGRKSCGRRSTHGRFNQQGGQLGVINIDLGATPHPEIEQSVLDGCRQLWPPARPHRRCARRVAAACAAGRAGPGRSRRHRCAARPARRGAAGEAAGAASGLGKVRSHDPAAQRDRSQQPDGRDAAAPPAPAFAPGRRMRAPWRW